MYRWNSRVPTVRWKDNCLSDRGTTTSSSSSSSAITQDIKDSNNTNACSKGSSTSISNSSCVGSGDNLSGSSLTFPDPIPSVTAVPISGVNYSPSSWSTNTLSNFSDSAPLSPPSIGASSSSSSSAAAIPTERENIAPTTSISSSTTEFVHGTRFKLWELIRTFLYVVSIVVREIRTLSSALLIGLLVNPINYCICSFSPSLSKLAPTPLFSSIGRAVPGGSSTLTRYYCCRRRNIISRAAIATTPFLTFFRCCCTCNCISFLKPVLGECGSRFATSGGAAISKDNSGGGASATRHSSRTVVGKPRLRKMAQIVSKTMTLLGVAFVIHFIIMSTFAEKEGFSQPRFSSVNMKEEDYKKPHYHHNYQNEMEIRGGRRLARSYRHEKHPTPTPENSLTSLTGHHTRLLTNKSEAVFSTENSTVIIAQIGSKTYLPCAVRNLGSGVASWIRRRDYHLLTVGMGTYSNDDRFMVSHNRPAQSWELHIKFVKPSDEGIYECQISTHPPSSIFVHLTVVEAKAEILGEPDKHVRSGSTFELVCVLRDSTEPPVYVFWYHNDRMINYDNVRGVQVSSDAEKSILTIQEAQKSDSGNYTCVPSNARPTSISVHILNGEKPAAMQHGSRSHSPRLVPACSTSLLFVTAFIVFVLTTWLATTNLSQQNLFYLHHQYQQGLKEKQQQNQFPNKAPPQSRLEKEKQQKESHQQNHYHHLYLQLLKKSEEFVERESQKWKKQENFPADDNPHDAIHNEARAVATALCLVFLLQLKRRTVEYSCKSNLKKLQPKTFLPSSAPSEEVTTTSPSDIRHRPADTIIRIRYSLDTNVYDYLYPRQALRSESTKNESKVEEEEETAVNITELDLYHKQNHKHTSLVAASVDFEVKMMMMTLMKSKWNDEKVKESSTLSSTEWDSQELFNLVKPEFHENKSLQQSNISFTQDDLEDEQEEEEEGAYSVIVKVAEILTTRAPGVAIIEPVTGSKSSTSMLTIFPSEFSISPPFSSSSSTYSLSSRVTTTTFPKAYRRFITAIISSSSNNPTQNLKEESSSTDEILGVENSIVIPLDVVIIRKEVDYYSLHHHFSMLFPSACSYYNSLTTSGLLSSSSSFLLFSNSNSNNPVVTPTRITIIMNTTPFRNLFCWRNNAEEDVCLPHTLVKRLATEFSVTVPNTNTTATTLSSVPTFPDCSLSMAQVVAR